jgi:RNA polymerase sigma-70 factor, ECF subfamily
MTKQGSLEAQFEAHRAHLRAVAYRILGSAGEAEDAVQEAWLRLNRAGAEGVDNLGGWLTTVVARVCLDLLRSRTSRREEPLPENDPQPATADEDAAPPDAELLMADSLSVALLIVLETLAPPERVAFVLHDVFELPFEEIASIVGRSPAAARQLASRARRRVRGASTVSDVDFARQRRVVDAFLAASRDGDFDALLRMLDPDVVLHADAAAVLASTSAAARGAPALATEIRGAAGVAGTFKGRAQALRAALVGGAVGAVWAPGGRPRVAFTFAVVGEKITGIEVVMEPARLAQFDVVMLGA